MANEILAKIGELEITEADIARVIATFPEENRDYLNSAEGRERILNQKIANVVMAMSAKENGSVLSPQDALRRDDFEEQYLAQMEIEEAFGALNVTEEDCLNYYEECKQTFQTPEEINAKHILVDSEEQIKEIKAKIEAGEMTFDEAAQKFSTCPSSEDGGELGFFSRGMMVPEFDEAAFNAELNVVTEPVKTQFGYHLILVFDKKEAGVTPFEDVKEQIMQQMTQMQQNNTLIKKVEDLKAKYGDVTPDEAAIDRLIALYPDQHQEFLKTEEGRNGIRDQKTAYMVLARAAKEKGKDQERDCKAVTSDFEEQIFAQEAIQALFDSIKVPEEEVRKYYELTISTHTVPEQVNAKHILVESEDLAKEIKAKIEVGEMTFEEAAEKYSTCPSKSRGGDLGMFERGRMVPEFDEASFAAELNVVTEPVKTQFGYHLIKVVDKTEERVKAFDEVRNQIELQMTEQRKNEAYFTRVEELKDKYGVVIL